jgi:hypothetical protein
MKTNETKDLINLLVRCNAAESDSNGERRSQATLLSAGFGMEGKGAHAALIWP